MRTILWSSILAAAASFGAVPAHFSFEENRGQISNKDVLYLARGRGYQLYLTPREAVLSLKNSAVLRMSLEGARPATVEPLNPLVTRTNYLIGAADAWRRDVPHWGKVRYRGVYPGIDLLYYGRDGELEYDFVVAPGTSASNIEMKMGGAESLAVGEQGELRMRIGRGTVTQKAPFAYQMIGGERRPVAVRYTLKGRRVGFEVSAYDHSRPLVIDPLLVYSTFLGGERTDEVTSVAVDKDGNTYLCGETTSGDFPTVNPFMKKPTASVHSFITKINAAGDQILYSTFLGGDGNTRANAIAVDADGNIYVAGRTGSRDFPLMNPVQSKQTGLNIVFVSKLNPAGDKLLFSTLLGGERNDEAYGLGLDDAGDIVVAGIAYSSEFPTVNAMHAKPSGGGDSFVAKFAAPDYRLAYNTYFGGAGNDEIHGLAVDGAGNAYVTGLTVSTDLATKDAFQTQMKSQDAFVAMLTPDGSEMGFFTYLGGTGYERGRAIKVAADGSIWVGGYATSANFPVTGDAFQPKMNGDSDAFIVRLSAGGQKLLYSTYLGGTKNAGVGGEEASAIAFDSEGAVLVAGVTLSADFPLVRPIQQFGGGKQDAFLVKFSADGGKVVFSTLLGGSGDEMAQALAVDGQGAAYVGGQTASADFPIKGGVRGKVGGANEGFLTKVCDPFLLPSSKELRFEQVLGGPAPQLQTVQVSTCLPIPFTAAAEGDFLSVTPGTGMTNTGLDVRVDGGALAVGEYTGAIRVMAPDAVNDPLLIKVTFVINPPPPSIESVVNADTGERADLTAGMVIEIRGAFLGPKAVGDGTSVFFDGDAGQVRFASDSTVRVMVPDSVTGRSETVMEVVYQGRRSSAVKLTVAQ